MILTEIILLAIALGMDALSVSLCKGLSMKEMKWKNAIIIGLYFGIFQAVMPCIGYVAGIKFQSIIESWSHWIALVLLAFIGLNMIKEAIWGEEEANDRIDFKTMIMLAIATSIDALIVGVTFAVLKNDIIIPAIIIGVITFIMSVAGVKLGNAFGNKMGKNAEIFGGIVLILIGIKVVVEHYLF